MNFKANYYMPLNIASDKWGKAGENDSYTGLLGEAIIGNADFYLGDLHYTLHNLNYFDLSTPYNTECLTFLTPESLTDNSWKLLILPFRYVDVHLYVISMEDYFFLNYRRENWCTILNKNYIYKEEKRKKNF